MSEPLKTKLTYYGISPWEIEVLYGFLNSRFTIVQEEIENNDDLKIAVSRLKIKFMSETQSLLHGDLHTGSIMVTENDTKVIDPEFAFYGPMGFDTGALIANLLMSYFSQAGHEKKIGDRKHYKKWLLETIKTIWIEFEKKFLKLWQTQNNGDAYPKVLFNNSKIMIAEKKEYMQLREEESIVTGRQHLVRFCLNSYEVLWIRAKCWPRKPILMGIGSSWRWAPLSPRRLPVVGQPYRITHMVRSLL